jgi:3-phenylpropionate/trans-cinnamate dioxygenase ferredoxin reductase component
VAGRIVVIGAGLAGAKTVEALRDNGFDGSITLVGCERDLPYERPPLSKDYLLGKAGLHDSEVHDGAWYRERRVDVRAGTVATALDTGAHTVTLADGTALEYDKAVLATGSVPKRPRIPGADATNVHVLRTTGDAELLRQVLDAGGRLVIVGGGWIGMEVAAAARQADVDVTVVESESLPLLKALGAELAEVYLELHLSHGVKFRPGAAVERFEVADGRVVSVELAGGTSLPADAVLLAVGAAPELGLARDAGLDVSDGVLVGADLRTSDPDVWAVGDIAEIDHPVLHRRIRVEHWAWALNQPAVAAAAILGQQAAFDDLPYFFSDQFDVGMEYIGSPDPDASVVFRGSRADREFVAFWLDGQQRVQAGMNVNVWDVVDDVKALILSGRAVDPARLADPAVPLPEV